MSVREFLYINLICFYGLLLEIVTKNSATILATIKHLAKKYKINHI